MSHHEHYNWFSKRLTEKLDRLESKIKSLEGLDEQIKLLETVYYKVRGLVENRDLIKDLKYEVTAERQILDTIGAEIKHVDDKSRAAREALAKLQQENVELKAKNEALELALEGYVKSGSK